MKQIIPATFVTTFLFIFFALTFNICKPTKPEFITTKDGACSSGYTEKPLGRFVIATFKQRIYNPFTTKRSCLQG